MDNFNKELINNIKLFQTEELPETSELKYAFISYVFSILESKEAGDLTLCEEEFPSLATNLDAYYYDEDSSTYNLYLGIFNENNTDTSFLSNEDVSIYYNKITNLVKKIINKTYKEFGDFSMTFDICADISRNLKNSEIVVNIISNYNIPNTYKKDDVEEIDGFRISFRTYDFEDLKDKLAQLNKENIELDCQNKFGEAINAIKISSTKDFDVYMLSMKGVWLAKLYKEDSQTLLEPNVRSYLKKTARVNAGIVETVRSYPEQFVAYNNGISAVATGITSIDNTNSPLFVKIKSINNFQIVNGGQTTATLSECVKEKLEGISEVVVPVKMTVVKNLSNAANLISNISVFSNTQTAIKKSDPPSNLPYYINIKKLSQKCLSTDNNINYVCYFERTSGEYDTELRRNNSSKKFTSTNPKDKKFTKIDLAIAINCWQQIPFKVCDGREKNFSFFNDVVKNQLIEPNEEYFKKAYATIILFRKLDKLAKKQKLTYKSNVVSYALSLMSYLYNKSIDLLKIWELKDLPTDIYHLAEDLLPKVHKIIADAPPEHPESRMWARKEKCWEKVKLITTHVDIVSYAEPIDFFPGNEAQLFIDNVDNFYNSSTWSRLLLWNDKYKILNDSQIRMIKFVKAIADKESNRLSKKQIDYAKDIFILAVKNKFIYKRED